MSYIHRPRRGSLMYSPRKRVKNRIPRIPSKVAPMNAMTHFLGVKAGLIPYESQEGAYEVATVIELPTYKIVNYFQEKRDSEGAWHKICKVVIDDKFQYLLDPIVRYTVEIAFNFKHTNSAMNKDVRREIILKGNPAEFEKLVSDLDGNYNIDTYNYYDVRCCSKSKGYEGIISRWGCKLKKRKHARASCTRLHGAVGARTPSKVTWRTPYPGVKGGSFRTIYNLEHISSIDENYIRNYIFHRYGLIKSKYMVLKGNSIGGPMKSVLSITPARRKL